MAGTDITLTPTAAEEIRHLMKQEGVEENAAFLRIGTREGGCSGLSYVMEFDSEKTADDEIFESQGVRILCDTKSYFNLAGIELDYQGGLAGRGFLFKNPNARLSCGCGKSFS